MKSTQPNAFSKLVRRWREARQLSRVDASKRLGIPLRTLESWEYGDRTPRGHYKRILEAKFSRP